MQWHISEIKGRNTKRSWRTRVRNFKAIGTLPCLCFSLWFFCILILSTARFLGLSGSQGGMYSLPSSLHDFQLYLACCILALRITGHLSLLIPHTHKRETSVVAQMVKSLPAMQETQVWTLGQEDTLEKEMAIHSSIFAWRIPRTEEPGEPQSVRLQRVGHNWATNIFNMKVKLIGTSWVRWPSLVQSALVTE